MGYITTPNASPVLPGRPVMHDSNNGLNCWTCRHDAQELNRVICNNFAADRAEPRSPSTGCPLWEPRKGNERIPVVACRGEIIERPKGEKGETDND